MLLFISLTFLYSAQNLNDDLDNDLVPNIIDKCPNTPEGVFVKRDGCTKPLHRNIYFNHASSVISEKFHNIIKNTAELIKETPGYTIFISGHTDSISDAKSNMRLSKERAIAVQNILEKNNVNINKIKLSWYGETMPVSSNITHLGRSENRRVNIILK
jgi:OOP family OmpA-OmpF porin